MNEQTKKVIEDYLRNLSDNALQAAIELMLTDRPTKEVVMALDAWSNYLEERI